uniref:Peptidase domain containing associated with muscle reration 1 n=1 Tax=Neolamprologus brichardi TaxID=32507 RepID=A0A3Q4HQ04_NEOBR
MCRPCCEYHLIQCRCPSKGSRVGYTVPCCRNVLDECDPCISCCCCSLFENSNDDFFVNGKYCTECRQGWSGGDCKSIIQRAQGHIALESYPTNARCEWIVQMERGSSIQLRFSLLSLESDHSCRYDYIEVRDGDSLTSPVIGRFCGDQLPPPIKSSGNFLHILFTSDGYNNFDGFVLTFQEISAHFVHVPLLFLFTCVCSASFIGQFIIPAPLYKPVNGYLLPVYGPEEELILVNYQCHPPFRLIGMQQRTCLPNGTWSGTAPSCVKGKTFFSLLSQPHTGPTSFHPVYTSIDYKCASPLYQNKGSSRRTCLKTGRWSGHYVSCSPGEISKSLRLWPWHAAIYIRSPPDHTVSTYTSPGRIITDQQGAPEETTFWFLACSGALVAQHRVLVVAQCVVDKNKQQPIQPEHVKVIIGKQYHTPRDQVSEIVVHPNFFSSPDSDVAVLKLKDKAKIREHVLPVCLPKTQGGEVTAQEAYTARWILPNNPRHLGHSATLSLTKLVELTDVTHCEREFAQGGAHTTAISDNSLCVISKPSSPQSPCPIVIPGITTMPAVFSSTRAVLSGHEDTHRASSAGWQLLGLERATSFEKNNCNQPSYRVHTQIANFQDWIEQHVK